MGKKNGSGMLVLLIILFLISSILFSYFYTHGNKTPSKNNSLDNTKKNISELNPPNNQSLLPENSNSPSNNSAVYQALGGSQYHKPILYKIIEGSCNELMVTRIRRAFQILQNDTGLLFNETKSNLTLRERRSSFVTLRFIGEPDRHVEIFSRGIEGYEAQTAFTLNATGEYQMQFETLKVEPIPVITPLKVVYWVNTAHYQISERGFIANGSNVTINLGLPAEKASINHSIYYLNDTDILITCSLEQPDDLEAEPGFYLPGASTVGKNSQGYAEIRFFNVINTIETRLSGGCLEYPDTELHEILHALGLQHSDDINNIMYPYGQSCKNRLDPTTVSLIKKRFSLK